MHDYANNRRCQPRRHEGRTGDTAGVRRRTENWEWSPSPRPRGIHRLFAGWDRVASLDNNHLIAITHAGRLSSTRLVDKTMDGPALE